MNLPMQPPLAHTIKRVCELTGLSKTSIYEAIRDAKLKSRKYGNRTLVLHDDLKSFITSLPTSSI